MPIGATFASQFDPNRGDLVYGLCGPRTDYLKDVKANFPDRWMIVDDYNNASILSAGGMYEHVTGVREMVYEAAKQFANDNGPARPVTTFLDDMYRSGKYNPYRAMKASEERLALEHGLDTDNNIQWLIIRRACKFGIEWVVEHSPAACIHFVLDGLNMDDVTQKIPRLTSGRQQAAVPITTSELLSIYRKWARPKFQQRILFYLNKKQVSPPWEQGGAVNAWQTYGRQRMEDHLAHFQRKLEAYSYSPHDQQWQARANQRMTALRQQIHGATQLHRYYEAVDTIKNQLDQLVPSWKQSYIGL